MVGITGRLWWGLALRLAAVIEFVGLIVSHTLRLMALRLMVMALRLMELTD
ncbi:MAG: hypothetical protein ACR5K7_00355 [Symbiopectobacterium sp.]